MADGTPFTWLKLTRSCGRSGTEEREERLVGGPHIDPVATAVGGLARVTVGVDVETVEAHGVGRPAVSVGEVALPFKI